MFTGTCIPISHNVPCSDLFFPKISNSSSERKDNPKDYSIYPETPEKSHYLYGFSFRVELYKDSMYEKCINSFIVWDTYPVKYQDVNTWKHTTEKAELLRGLDRFRYESRNTKLLDRSSSAGILDVADLVVKITLDRHRGSMDDLYHFCIADPRIREVLKQDFYSNSDICCTKFSEYPRLLLYCSESYIDSVSKGLSSKDVKKEFRHYCGHRSPHSLMTKIGFCAISMFGKTMEEKKDYLWRKIVANESPSERDSLYRRLQLAHMFSEASKNFAIGCSREISASPEPELPHSSAVITPEKTLILQPERNGNTHLTAFVNSFDIDRNTTEDFGMDSGKCGRVLICENVNSSNENNS